MNVTVTHFPHALQHAQYEQPGRAPSLHHHRREQREHGRAQQPDAQGPLPAVSLRQVAARHVSDGVAVVESAED